MLFYPLQRHHPSTCVSTLTPNTFANITGSDPSELCFSTNSEMIFIEVAYAVIFICEKEGKKKGEVATIVGAEAAGRMGLFWLVMEVWVCLVTGNKKIFVLGLTPHLLTCFFLITCSFIIGPIVHIVGIVYKLICSQN